MYDSNLKDEKSITTSYYMKEEGALDKTYINQRMFLKIILATFVNQKES